MIFVQKLEDITLHHPGFPKETTTTEELLSIFVHEFFHVVQFTNPKISQFMDDHLQNKTFLDQTELIQFYSKSSGYQECIKKEYVLLSDYLKNQSLYSQRSAQQTLKKWLVLYDQRIRTYSKEFANGRPNRDLKMTDSFWTLIEGTARFIESDFLINPELHSHFENLKSDPYFKNFLMIKGTNYSSLPASNKNIGNKYYYSIGMHLTFILDIATNKKWRQSVFDDKNFLDGQIRSL